MYRENGTKHKRRRESARENENNFIFIPAAQHYTKSGYMLYTFWNSEAKQNKPRQEESPGPACHTTTALRPKDDDSNFFLYYRSFFFPLIVLIGVFDSSLARMEEK